MLHVKFENHGCRISQLNGLKCHGRRKNVIFHFFLTARDIKSLYESNQLQDKDPLLAVHLFNAASELDANYKVEIKIVNIFIYYAAFKIKLVQFLSNENLFIL